MKFIEYFKKNATNYLNQFDFEKKTQVKREENRKSTPQKRRLNIPEKEKPSNSSNIKTESVTLAEQIPI